MLERDIKNYLVTRCKSLGIYHRKYTSPGHAGVPDWILANNSKVVFLELKAPKKEPTPAQWREIKILRDAGVYATYASSYAEIEFILSYLIEK